MSLLLKICFISIISKSASVLNKSKVQISENQRGPVWVQFTMKTPSKVMLLSWLKMDLTFACERKVIAIYSHSDIRWDMFSFFQGSSFKKEEDRLLLPHRGPSTIGWLWKAEWIMIIIQQWQTSSKHHWISE